MGVLVMIGQVLLGLSLLIVLHELGHFLAARAFGIKVEKFYLFFDAWGVKLFKFNYKGCEYGIGWLPLGGYVKIAGMVDESMDTEQLKQDPQPWEFRSKPAWQRLIVMLGGIIVNVIVGVFVFWMLTFHYGISDIDNTKLVDGVVPGIVGKAVGIEPGDRILKVNGQVPQHFNQDLLNTDVLFGGALLTVERGGKTIDIPMPADMGNMVAEYKKNEFVQPRVRITAVDQVVADYPAAKMGILAGDSIISLNNKAVLYQDEVLSTLKALANKPVQVGVFRSGQELALSGTVSEEGTLGIQYNMNSISLPFVKYNYGFWEALPIGSQKAFGVITDNIKGFGKIFRGDLKADKALSGPVGIATMFGTEVDWARFWSLVGLISMALAFMNLLPIPALDGGHVVFLLVEMIQGKPLSDAFLERAQMVGFFILVALMIFVFGNDIFKLTQ
ncbi:RIP metalloprotease RseP [Sphingobacterium sp. lm-10]|uniref:RIP metalloprotease RseP n=1 Tax=Sphingobacterium sp. lm-10 TaxID=2944904 RepID=UPI002021A6E0|nr:RIP metalloprotease RseP [Sphingobacterium sp. lm-10]MCL7987975.1 RIP metalloprotease RseP [Sphingobacterium sp. lm-10]